MAANGRGYMRPNSAGRTPPFLIIGLLVVISILAFNYWSLSSKNNALTREIDEAEMKYRSVQVRKLDVEKRNAELSTLLDEAKKYKQAAQEKDMKLREAEQKERELNAKIDNLAGEAEVMKNDLNTCDDEVGFCHENITKMIIAHKKALEEAQMKCNVKVDEARSSAEQRAASVEKLDVQQSQQQQQPLQEQKQTPQEQLQSLQEQQKPQLEQLQQVQQPFQEQQQLQMQKVPQEQQQQPQQLPQEQQQPQLQQLPQAQQHPQLQHQSLEPQQPQLQQLPLDQQQPQLQQPPKEQFPHDQLQQQEEHMEGRLHEQQQQIPNVTKQNKEGQLEQKQELTVLQGLSQTNDLAKAMEEAPSDSKQQMASSQGQQLQLQQQQQAQQQQVSALDTPLPAVQSVQEQKPENMQPQETKQLLPGEGLQGHAAVAPQSRYPDNKPLPNEVAPAGHAIVQDSVHVAQEKEVTKDRPVDLEQRRDQAAYLGHEAAPVGQADETDEVLPQFHEYAEAGREQVNELQQNDRDIEQIPQQGPLA